MMRLQTLLQINDYPERYKERLLWLVKIVATGACLWLIITHLSESSFPPGSLLLSAQHIKWVALTLVLMPLNWYLEVEKWRLSVPDEHLTFREALSGVLSGLALSWVVPFTLGDLSGRLATVSNHKKSGFALLIIRSVSLGLTMAFGGYALLFYFGFPSLYYVLVVVGLLVMFLILRKLYGTNQKGLFAKITGLSVARYLVFTLQFFVIIWAFLPTLPVHIILLGIGWVFLFRSVVPSLFGNFGVREASALLFFESYLDQPSLILLPCLLIWLINTVIPSLVGTSYVFKLKLNIAR